MSPAAALDSEVFVRYAVGIAVLLTAVGALLLILSRGFGKRLGGVWHTYRGWLLMAPLFLGAVLAGREAFIVFVGLVACAAFKEFARATGLYRDWWMTGTVYLGITALVVVTLIFDPNTGRSGWYGLYMAMPAYAVCAILMVPIVRNRTRGQLQAIALAILGFVYFGWMFGHLGFLANARHAYGYLLYLACAVACTDVAAFTCGKLFGRRPLRSAISPNKTWEGSLGAFAVAMVLPWLLAFSFPHFGPAQLLLTGLIIGIGGQLGDLTISVIKRDLGIKDMGAAIPGHGGLLDRIDSLIFTAPLFFHMGRTFYGLY